MEKTSSNNKIALLETKLNNDIQAIESNIKSKFKDLLQKSQELTRSVDNFNSKKVDIPSSIHKIKTLQLAIFNDVTELMKKKDELEKEYDEKISSWSTILSQKLQDSEAKVLLLENSYEENYADPISHTSDTFTCDLCNKSFPNVKQQNSHFVSHNETDK